MAYKTKDVHDVEELLDFDELLMDATDVDDRTKSLWIEIYRNACRDREVIDMLYTDITKFVLGSGSSTDPTAHAVHGPTITKYIEKISRANDQLLKLADLIQSYRRDADRIDPDSILSEIEAD